MGQGVGPTPVSILQLSSLSPAQAATPAEIRALISLCEINALIQSAFSLLNTLVSVSLYTFKKTEVPKEFYMGCIY